uniref:ORF42h n=1 Tax=Pinus koraiensis TaxID=88728 RepID=Q85WV3_PINKO|nr:ORF42h [Pinus koraiensis]AAO74116.1 ORF42h [Pinus koraiensis]
MREIFSTRLCLLLISSISVLAFFFPTLFGREERIESQDPTWI